MNVFAVGLCMSVLCLFTALGNLAHADVVVDWVTVGDAGNTADGTGYGAVAADFRIMKYEFMNQQYAQFLNAVDPEGVNPNLIYNTNMGSDPRGGIAFVTGNANGSKYTTKANMADKPVNYVNWWDAARVANWLHNGQGSGSTETGAYTLNNAISGTVPAVNAGAIFFIPTENQWYKAAYFKGGSTNAGYWDYATQTDTTPTAVTAGVTGIGSAGSAGNFANFGFAADWNGQDGNVTTIGTNGGPSSYGTFDMGGNNLEWNDLTGQAGVARALRGGAWNLTSAYLSAALRIDADPSFQDYGTVGFRLAAVPEPAASSLAAIGLAVAGMLLRRPGLLTRAVHVAP